ncbi:MAG TPA: hypothetical protein PK573_12045 [Spirochaetota bacterium]|nr:hypothetical protein [Spirochaetota bacterium]
MSQKNISKVSSDEDHPIFTPSWARRIVGNPDFDDPKQRVRARAENQAIDRVAAVALFCAQASCQLGEQAQKFGELPELIKRVFGLPLLEDADTLSVWSRRHGNARAHEEAVQIIQDIAKAGNARTAPELLDELEKFAIDCTHSTIDSFMAVQEQKQAAPAAPDATQKPLDNQTLDDIQEGR